MQECICIFPFLKSNSNRWLNLSSHDSPSCTCTWCTLYTIDADIAVRHPAPMMTSKTSTRRMWHGEQFCASIVAKWILADGPSSLSLAIFLVFGPSITAWSKPSSVMRGFWLYLVNALQTSITSSSSGSSYQKLAWSLGACSYHSYQ